MRTLAKVSIAKVQTENQKPFNEKRTESTKFKLKDLVTIKRTQFGTGLKLLKLYFVPYTIIKIKI